MTSRKQKSADSNVALNQPESPANLPRLRVNLNSNPAGPTVVYSSDFDQNLHAGLPASEGPTLGEITAEKARRIIIRYMICCFFVYVLQVNFETRCKY